jgi:hypothetical protein
MLIGRALCFGFVGCPSDVCSGNASISSGVVFVWEMKKKGNSERTMETNGVRKSNYSCIKISFLRHKWA